MDYNPEDCDSLTFGQNSHTALRAGLDISKLTEGTQFEVDVDDKADESDDEADFWNKDDILQDLRDRNYDDEEDTSRTYEVEPFDDKVKQMESVIEGEVFKRIIKQGVGPQIEPTNAVMYHCEAYLEGFDEPFDSTVLRNRPFLHRLSEDFIVHGLYHALLTMRKAERAEVLVRPEYALGKLGCPPRVPPNATVAYVVEVIKTFEEGTLVHYQNMPFEEQQRVPFNDILQMCDKERISGNTYFVDGKIRDAILRYKRAIQILEQRTFLNQQQETQAKVILLKLYSNIANGYNKLKRPLSTMKYSKRALDIDQNCVKALYHYGIAKKNEGQYDAAMRYLLKAQTLEPQNTAISAELKKVNHKIEMDSLTQHNLYKKMSSVFIKE